MMSVESHEEIEPSAFGFVSSVRSAHGVNFVQKLLTVVEAQFLQLTTLLCVCAKLPLCVFCLSMCGAVQRSIRPRTRDERKALNDKVSLEKNRINKVDG